MQKKKKPKDDKAPISLADHIEHRDLGPWLEDHLTAIRRTVSDQYAPIVTDETVNELRRLMVHFNRLPAGKQDELIATVADTMRRNKSMILAVQPGGGKSKCWVNGIQLAEGYFKTGTFPDDMRAVIVAPGYLLYKWAREILQEAPNARICVVRHVRDFMGWPVTKTKKRKDEHDEEGDDEMDDLELEPCSPNDAQFILLSYNRLSISASKEIAAVPKVVPVWSEQENKFVAPRDTDGNVIYRMTCPKCGQDTGMSPRQLAEKWVRCTYRATRWVKSEGYHPKAVMRNGVWMRAVEDEKTCGEPLWQYVADPPKYVIDGRKYTGRQDELTALTEQRVIGQTLVDANGELGRITPIDITVGGPLGEPRIKPLAQYEGQTSPYIRRFKGQRKVAIADYMTRYWRREGERVPVKHAHPERPHKALWTRTVTKLRPRYACLDEIHLAKAEKSARGQAAARLAFSAQSVQGLTGTLMGGYASTLFYIFYRMDARFRQLWRADSVNEFIHEVGHFERKHVIKVGDTGTYGRQSKRGYERITEREVAGILPKVLAYCMHMIAFAQLDELFDLPEYKEQVHYHHLDDTQYSPVKVARVDAGGNVVLDDEGEVVYDTKPMNQAEWHEHIKSRLEEWCKKVLKEEHSRRALSRTLQVLLAAQNAPHLPVEVIDKETGKIVVNIGGMDANVIYPKERAIADSILADAQEGRRSLVYVGSVNRVNVPERLKWVLEHIAAEKGMPLNVQVLRSSSTKAPEDRELWIRRKLKQGMQVMICNPKLVEMGLDLTEFSRVHFYQLPYSVYVVIQASRRSLRPGAKEMVMVHYWVYNDTMEPRVVRLMAGKKRATKHFEGNMVREAFVQEAGEEEVAYATALSIFNMMSDDGGQTQKLLDEANAEDRSRRPKIKPFTVDGVTYTQPVPFVVDAATAVPVEAAAEAPSDPLVEDVDIISRMFDLFDPWEMISSSEFMKQQLAS